MKLYAIALSAVRRPAHTHPETGKTEHALCALAIAADQSDEDSVEGGARNTCLERYPPTDGWYGHLVSVVGVPDDELAKLKGT